MNDYAIEIKSLSVSYERKRVLYNITMNMERGQLVAVIGPNGAGKSTLFKSILELGTSYTGEIKVLGKDFKEVRKMVAYVPQRDEVDWTFPATVEDIVLMGRYPHKKILQRLNTEDRQLALVAMQKLGIEDLRERQIGALSGGQQQRVFIARALCQDAELFFLDEPFVGVDITTEQRIISLLQELAANGKTVLVVHHDLSTVKDYFSHVIMINQRLIGYGPTQTIFTQENIAKTYAPQMKILQDVSLLEFNE